MLLLALAIPGGVRAEEIVEQPLTAVSLSESPTLFARLAPETTGLVVENRFEDVRMHGELFQEFDSSSIGTGIAVGDYDADGKPDLFVVSKTESSRLFRNLGDWKFEDVTAQAGVADTGETARIWKQGAAFADVNNDGRLDLYVCRFDAPNLLYVNQGDGTFKEEAATRGLAVKDSSVMAAFADFDRDGWLDLYLTTNILRISDRPEGQPGYLFRNNGDGTFRDVTASAGIEAVGQSHSATWWDFNEDGWPDLYVGFDYGVPDRLYRNQGDGTFKDVIREVLPHTAFSSMGSDLGDVNNDGRIDFLVADMAATTHETDQRFLADARGRTEDRPEDDRRVRMVHRNALLLNTGTPHFQEAALLAGIAATDWTWSVRFEDLDNDGRLDLFVTNGFHRTPSVDVIRRLMNATSVAERMRILVNSPVQTEANLAFRNLGDLQFEDASKAWGLDETGVSFGTAFGDLDGDGDLDLVYSNYRGGITVLRNESDEAHRIIVQLHGTTSNRWGCDARVEIATEHGVQVRTLTLSRGYLSTSEPVVHFGVGSATTISRLTVHWPSGHQQTFEDLPADRRFTITERAESARLNPLPSSPGKGLFEEVSADLGLALMQKEPPTDELTRQRLLPRRLNRQGPAVAVAEVRGQGPIALALGGTSLAATRVFVQNQSGFKEARGPVSSPAAVNDGPLLWVETNDDGAADLLVSRSGNSAPAASETYQPKLYLGDGRGGWSEAAKAALPPMPVSVGAMAAADFDGDGRLDVFIGGRHVPGSYPQVPRSVMLRNRGGRFEDVTDRVSPTLHRVGLVTAALATDVDGDGWTDLLIACDWGVIRCFRNIRGLAFEDESGPRGFAAAGTGWWRSLAAADFNADGRLDYAVGNVGLNTQYRASPENPAILIHGDLKADGSVQLLEAYAESGVVYPWRTRRDLGAVFPWILKRYPENAEYARAPLAEIFGDRLARAETLVATELRSGVFLSRSDGTHQFQPLPRIAQVAPMEALVAGDFDGDGDADLYGVQNDHSPIPAVGPFDGGISQLLLGDGKGGFRAMPPSESRLIVPGDAKALAVFDPDEDGRPDFIATQNNDTPRVFRNQGLPGRSFLRISLEGPSGNPTGVGCWVTLELADGTRQLAEIHAGSGRYSQSLAAAFFGYPEKNPPRRIQVRWPTGEITSHEVPSGVKVLRLSAP